jgi:hypothetical protein
MKRLTITLSALDMRLGLLRRSIASPLWRSGMFFDRGGGVVTWR